MERENARKGCEGGRGWMGRALAAVLVGGAVLALGGASTRNAVAGSTPSASARVETASGGQAIHYADAQRDVLDLQLD